MESKVDNQVAAPAETRTPNLHRAKIAHRRVRMEGWRQWQIGGREKLDQRKDKRSLLAPTGLLMEGGYTQNPSCECNGDFSPATAHRTHWTDRDGPQGNVMQTRAMRLQRKVPFLTLVKMISYNTVS